MPKKKEKSKEVTNCNIRELIKAGKSPKEAIEIAVSNSIKNKKKKKNKNFTR